MITQAEQIQASGIQGWSAPAAQNIDRTVIAGSGQCTPQEYYEFTKDNAVKVDVLENNGDNTVPLFSADMHNGNPNQTKDTAQVYYASGIGHSDLPNSLAREVAALLIGKPLYYSKLRSLPTTAYCIQFELFSDANLQVTDAAGNITGVNTRDPGDQTNIPGSDFFLFPNNQIAVVPSGGPYILSINGTGSSTFDLRLREWQDATITSTILYRNVPVTPNTHARLVYQTGNTLPILEVDENGDGIFELQISPSIVLGAHMPDEQPPATTITASGTPGLNGWYTSNVTVTLSAVDNPGGTGVLTTEYSVDGGKSYQAYTSPFTISQEGTLTILARSVDREGNVEDPPVSQTFSIDKTPPTLVVTVTPSVLWPPNNKLVTIYPTVQVSDNLDPNPTVKLVSITSSEPDSGLGDIVVQPDGTVLLRAERLGNDKNGRTYTITYSAQDAAGNITIKSVMVTVPHNR